eukprot:m.49866 g.49866  ORF g.49866 m.49866 type:complete len:63 (-) comp12505_c2_seq2:602-790(-)
MSQAIVRIQKMGENVHSVTWLYIVLREAWQHFCLQSVWEEQAIDFRAEKALQALWDVRNSGR